MIAAAIFAVDAKELTVTSVKQIATPADLVVGEAAISADGTYVVVSDVATNSLSGLTLANGNIKKIADNGNMLDLQMSTDGSNVVYRQRVFDAKRRSHTGVKATNTVTGKTVTIAEPSRNFNGFTLSNNGVVQTLTSDAARPVRKAKSLTGAAVQSASAPVVGINRGDLVVTNGSNTKVLNPQGKGSYLWPSISPDGKKIVYYKAQAGCFVCDLDGSNVISLGYIHAPKWFGNDTIIGMQDIDDGTNTTASTVVAAGLDGKMQKLTDSSVIAMYPSGSVAAGNIVFSDNMGKLYLMTVK